MGSSFWISRLCTELVLGESFPFLCSLSLVVEHILKLVDRLRRASIATFPSPPTKKNTYIQLEPNKVVSELSQLLLTRQFTLVLSCLSSLRS